jgi:Na+/melibiose symporter-like transporter
VPRWLKAAFSIGSTGEAMVFTGVNAFILIFYNQVKGLPPHLVATAYSIGILLNAVTEPMIGSLSDRTLSRLGRRHPYMFAAIIPVAVCFYGLFNPPAWLGQTGELLWLAVVNVLLWQALSFFHVPHLALGGELSGDYLERSRVMAWNTFFLWMGDSLSWLLGFAWFFRPTPALANGALDAGRYPSFSICVALTVALCLSLSAVSTLPAGRRTPQASPGTSGFSVRALLQDVRKALANRNYRALLFGALGYSLMSGVRNGLTIYVFTYFWQITSSQQSLFVIGSFAGYLFACSIIGRLHARFDKRATNVAAVLFNVLVPAVPILLGMTGVLSPSSTGLMAILIAFGALGHMGYSLLMTTQNSCIADIADENELRFGERQQGILYSTRTIFIKLDQAFGTALAGWVLSIIGFPSNARIGQVPAQTLHALGWSFVAVAVPALVGIWFFAQYRLNRRTWEETRAALRTTGALS